MSWRQGRLCTFVLQMPLHQANIEPTTHTNDRQDLRDIILGLNPKEGQKGEGGGGAHNCGSLGHMAIPDRQTVQLDDGVHK